MTDLDPKPVESGDAAWPTLTDLPDEALIFNAGLIVRFVGDSVAALTDEDTGLDVDHANAVKIILSTIGDALTKAAS